MTPVSHRGTGGAEVAPGFAVGDRILFVYGVALEKMRSFAGKLCVVAQEEVQAVWEPDSEPDMHPRAD
jgi:hypothetical protein